MTDITHEEVRDALPDLLHDRLDAGLRASVDKHLVSCAACSAELAVLRMVSGAPSFEPTVDAAKIAALIPPYGGVIQRERAVHRTFWQVSAVLAAAILVAGSVVLLRREPGQFSPARNPAQVAATPKAIGVPARPSADVPAAGMRAPTTLAVVSKPAGAPKRQELQLAAGLDGVSDRDVARLLRELDNLDGLPSPDPEPLGLSEGDASGVRGGDQ